MRITESALRRIIQEELESLHEVVRNKHGYSVSGVTDITWSNDKRRIPMERNPFVGSSPAFDSWYNDGEIKRPWMRILNRDTPRQKEMFGVNDINFDKGDHVIVPSLGDVRYTSPGVIMSMHHKSPYDLGIPGARRDQTIPLVDIMWQQPMRPGYWLNDVGLAFVNYLGGPRMQDPEGAANYAMRRYKNGVEAQRDKEERAAERDARRAEREERRAEREERRPPPAAATPSSPPAGVVRRVGGVAPPPPPKKPMKMTDNELRDSLGLPRRR